MWIPILKANGEYELTDIEPDEISFVDRAANKKKFLVVKRDGNHGGHAMNLKLTKDEKAAMVKAMQEIMDRAEHMQKGVTDAEEVEAVEKSDREGLDVLVDALVESLQAIKKKKADGDPAPAGDKPPKPTEKMVECPSCGWKGEQPEDGKCPKCGAAIKGEKDKGKDGDKDKDMAKRMDELKKAIADLTTQVEKLKTPAPAPAGDTPPPADPPAGDADKVKKELDAIKKRQDEIEKNMPDFVASGQQEPGSDPEPGDEDKWPADLAEDLKEKEEKKTEDKK